jgi:hypothetical protein
MTNQNGDHRMTLVPRIASIAAALLIGAGSVASANTMELTLTVPLKITLPPGAATSPALDAAGGRKLKPFDVNCVVGSGLGYATGAGAQGNVVGTGSTATSGSLSGLQNPDGSAGANPTATVIITYDDGVTATGAGAKKTVSGYLCWIKWKTDIPSLAPIFVQGNLAATSPLGAKV